MIFDFDIIRNHIIHKDLKDQNKFIMLLYIYIRMKMNLKFLYSHLWLMSPEVVNYLIILEGKCVYSGKQLTVHVWQSGGSPFTLPL